MNIIQPFNLNQRKKKVFNPDDYITLYADASFDAATKTVGIAFYVRHKEIKFLGGRAGQKPGLSNSTRAELHAVLCGVEWIKKHINCENKILTISSDCMGALEKFPTRQVKNELNLLRISFKHTKGHSNIKHARTYINNKVDKLARSEMRAYRDALTGAC